MPGSIAFLLLAAPAVAAGAANAPSVESILAANREAVGAVPLQGTLTLAYTQKQSGLSGTAVHTVDLATGAFIERSDSGVVSEARGFDGRIPWQTDVSGVSTDQLGGDRVPVAVNQAYRNANSWWRADRGGAEIAYIGRDNLGGQAADHLAVTPRGGGRFDAWFDVHTHMLVRTAEPQQFFHTKTTYSDYAPITGAMIAHSCTIDFGTGDPTVLHLTRAEFRTRPLAAYSTPTAKPAGGHIEGGAKSVTLPITLLNNHVYVQARINGKGPYTFIVDTGGHTLIAPRVAKEVGLKVFGAGASSGAGEKTGTLGFARYHEIALGAVRLTDQPAFVTDIYDASIEGIPVDGMVGFELFARFAVQIDYGTKTMTITDFDAFSDRNAGTRIPFKFYDHLPAVDGFIDNLPARFDIDTGSRAEVDVTSPFVKSHKLRGRYQPGISAITGWGVGGASLSYVVRMPSLTLGGVKVPNVVAGLSEAKAGSFSDPSFDGNIGSGLLKRFVATFDYSHQAMYLKPLDPQPTDAGAFDRSGMWINASDAGPVVEQVSPGGPADQAGLIKGDVITAINGKAFRREELSDVRTMLKTLPAGSTAELSIRRNGREQAISVRLRDLI